MTRRPRVSARIRRVATRLREYRHKAHFTCVEAAAALGTSPSKISRMETGERGLNIDDVAALLGLYRVPVEERAQILKTLRSCHEPNWWQLRTAEALPDWREFIELESEALAITNLETMVVPGLLQTPDYARVILQATGDEEKPDAEVQQLVEVRMARQSILSKRNAPTLHAIIDEAVLRRPVGEPGVLLDQLQHLLSSARRPNVQLQVIPFAAGATPGLDGPAALLDLPTGETLLLLETRRASGFVTEESLVRRARLGMRRLSAMALSPAASVEFITTIVGELAGSTQESP